MSEDPLGSERARNDITRLLHAHRAGDEAAMHELAPLVYDQLQRIAHLQLGGERPGRTLQTTGLVHEAFVKFAALDRIERSDRSHFFALSARLMRQVLLDAVKRSSAQKRDGIHVTLGPAKPVEDPRHSLSAEALIDLDRALDRLAARSERQARVVECRFFAGLSVEETAEALGISVATVKRDWQFARAWLNRELS
ncbi:MAG: ECF-type sigma factor [Gemmatimonadota bacterium]